MTSYEYCNLLGNLRATQLLFRNCVLGKTSVGREKKMVILAVGSLWL